MSKFTSFLIAAVILQLTQSSCRKVYDFIHDHPDAHDSLCRITKINVTGFNNDPEEIHISYNAKGDPVNMLISNGTTGSGNLNSYFQYDKFGRLLYFSSNYVQTNGPPPTTPPGGLIFHKYAYPRPNFVTDTVIFYTPGNPPMYDSAVDASISGYTLDLQGRIVKVWTLSRDPHQPPQLAGDITYDANGNLPLTSPDLSYDDKVNVYRTNKVWQFVNNDYSRNNVIKNDHFFFPVYNDFGLPLNIRNLTSYNIYPFGLQDMGTELDITYACSAPKGPINY